jgi:hypothetical protein
VMPASVAMADVLADGDGELFLGPLLNRSGHTRLKDFISANKNRLIMSHINCNHLLPHMSEMRIMFQNSGVDVIGVNETFLNDAISSDAVEIQGYVLLRNDRTVFGRPQTQGGGVGIYLKSGIKYRVLAKSKEIGIEFLFAEIIINTRKILIASIYRPPNSSIVYQLLSPCDYGLQSLEDAFSELIPIYNEVFLFGDFNINLLISSDPLFNTFQELLIIFMLYNVSVVPTRSASGTLLDLFLVSNPQLVADFYQMNVDWSDHDALFLSSGVGVGSLSDAQEWVRSFKGIDEDDFLLAAAQLDWSSIMYIPGVNEKVDKFYFLIGSLLDTFAPLKLVKRQQNKSLNAVENWITEEVLQLIEDRDSAYKV